MIFLLDSKEGYLHLPDSWHAHDSLGWVPTDSAAGLPHCCLLEMSTSHGIVREITHVAVEGIDTSQNPLDVTSFGIECFFPHDTDLPPHASSAAAVRATWWLSLICWWGSAGLFISALPVGRDPRSGMPAIPVLLRAAALEGDRKSFGPWDKFWLTPWTGTSAASISAISHDSKLLNPLLQSSLGSMTLVHWDWSDFAGSVSEWYLAARWSWLSGCELRPQDDWFVSSLPL